MREICSSGSVRGTSGNGRPYRERNLAVRPGAEEGRVAALLRTSIICRLHNLCPGQRRTTNLGPVLSSITRPEFDIERGFAANAAFLAAQLPFERHQACVTGPTLQK